MATDNTDRWGFKVPPAPIPPAMEPDPQIKRGRGRPRLTEEERLARKRPIQGGRPKSKNPRAFKISTMVDGKTRKRIDDVCAERDIRRSTYILNAILAALHRDGA